MSESPVGRMTHQGLKAHTADGGAGRITQAGLVARSPEGTAAKGMQIKGKEDLWVEIQANTFRNWVNEHLRPANLKVIDLAEDLKSGTHLCALVEQLQGRPLKPSWHSRPASRHHSLENVTAALRAIEADGVKLVNIGNVDIVNGNLKLILGLIWSLIVRYQIGRSKFPPRKLMLAWLQAVLPECKVSNLTTDWNSGILLSALVDYCKPGLFSHWRSLNPNDSIENCSRAMNLAQREFGIPRVLEPEYLASPWLDELSGMTYLSYFMKPDSPGFHATLRWVNSRLERSVKNFTTDWNDGKAACEVIRGLGGPAPAPEKLKSDPSYWEHNLQQAIDAGKKLNVQPILSAKDMSQRDVEHLGVMAYAAHFQWVKPRPPLSDMIQINLESTSGRVGEPMNFRVDLLSKELDYSQVRAYVITPAEQMHPIKLQNRGHGVFTPDKMGMHEIVLDVDDIRVDNRFFFRVLPRLVTVAPPGMAPCALGSLVEVLVNATGAPKREDILVTAYSPSGRELRCPLQHVDDTSSAIFKPDEPGTWEIAITYQGKNIQGGPFTCDVFDPAGVSVSGLEGATAHKAHYFHVDTSGCGMGIRGELNIDIVHDKRSVMCAIEKLDQHIYRVSFMPKDNGKHRIYIYFNGFDVKGSPFMMRVGSHKSRHSTSKARESPARMSSPVNKYRESSPYDGSGLNQDYGKTKSYESKYDDSNAYKSSYTDDYNIQKTSYDMTDSSYITRVNKTQDINSTSKFRSESPRNSSSSPITTKYLGDHRNDLNRTSSPIYRTASPIGRTGSPVGRTASPINRTASPIYNLNKYGRDSPSMLSTRVVEKSSNYRMHSSYNSNQEDERNLSIGSMNRSYRNESPNDNQPGVDHSSNIKLSAIKGSSRRDSWDAIAKTKHLMSANSLESLANLAESQLNTDLSYGRPATSQHDSETRRNTQLNKFASYTEDGFNEQLDNLVGGVKHLDLKPNIISRDETGTDGYFSKDYNQTSRSQIVNSSTSYTRRDATEDGAYSHSKHSFLSSKPPREVGGALNTSLSETDATHNRFRSLQTSSFGDKGGGSAVHVQNIPNGVVGKPVEFEIDGSRAGSGNLEILVNGGRVTSSVRALGGQRFLAAFTPHQATDHTVQITFNGETVPGSPWQVSVMSAGGVGAPVGGSASIVGDSTRLVPARLPAVFEVLNAPGSAPFTKGEINVNVIAPSKHLVPSRILDTPGKPSAFKIEFIPDEVGTHVIEVSIAGNKLSAGPLIAKVYDASLIQVNDVSSGVVGQPCQFRVDASAAGEGQLEISINEGEVPNHVQVVGGGRCLVSFTPDQAKPHYIDIKFNGETVIGCPFVCNIADTSRVTLNLSNLELIPVGSPSTFQLSVRGGGAAELAVAVRGPRGELPVRVTGDAHTGFTAEFTPHIVGPHTLTVDYNGHPVQGTPFMAKAYDARLVAVGGVSGGGAVLGGGVVGGSCHFTVDASQAGEGNLEITISALGLNIPTQVHPQGNARFSVSFVPAEACDHIVNVSFNKTVVPGCPIIVPVSGGLGGPQVSLPGPGPVNQATTLLINHPGGRLEDVEVNVEGPNGSSVPATVQQTGEGLFKAEFVPRGVGEHRINVMVQGQTIPGSPFAAKVYDVNAIKVKEVTNGTIGKPVTFLVETSQAGPGNLEVTVNGGRVPTSAEPQRQHLYAISFTPRDPTPHTVDLRFNGQDVPGSPFQCLISSPARVVDVESLEKVSVGSTFEFTVESPTTPTVEILGPARRPVAAQVIPNDGIEEEFGKSPINQAYKIRFTPIDVGDHSIEVRLPQGGHVEGSPFLLKAYSAERVSVTDIIPGTVGKPVSFTINASQAGAGNLEIIVAVAGRNVPNYVHSEGNARFKVNFKPTEAAPHSLSVRFNGRAVPGSPFTCPVGPAGGTAPSSARARGLSLRSAQRGHNGEIQLSGFSGSEPQVSISGPGGTAIRSHLSAGSAADTWNVRWMPEQVGRHQISITAGPSHHVQGSPFTCNVYDVDKVRVTGLGAGGLEGMVEGLSLGESIQGEVGKPVTFSVDAASAGEGTLELVVSTAKSTVKAEVVACARGLYDVTFIPQTCEAHFVNITFNEAAVPGSPFQCDVHETVNHVQIGGTATIDLPTSSHTVEIIAPDNQTVPHTTNHGVAEFKTDQIGHYNVRILNSSGSTISAKSVNVFDTSLIKVLPIRDAYCHRPAIITVSVADAGAGVLTALVRCGGASVPHSVRSQGTRHELVYHPSRAAPHTVALFYNGVPVSRRPLRPNVLPPAVGQEVTSSGLGLYQAKVGQVSTFSIDTLGRPAREFDVVVSGPGGIALPVRCYQTKSGQLQAEFTVSQVGQCTIEVLHLSKPVSGSPFTCHSFDPAKVSLSNVPQGNVSVHTPISFTVNHSDAGLAELDVTATSPLGHSLPLDITAQGEGEHHVQLLPTMPGHYRLYITYGGVGVAGSPLSLGVVGGGVGTGSTSAARALGAGLQAAHVGKEAAFTVISHDAQPNVQIEKLSSPEEQGSPGQLLDCVVVQNSGGEWRCTYIPLYVGLYEVRISCPRQGPLPGSPWELKVIDTSQVSLVGGWALHLDDSGRVKIPAKLVFDTSNAGPGQLECLLNGRHVSVETVNSRAVVSLSTTEGSPEEMTLELTYSGAAVGGAPRAAHGAPGSVNTASGPAERVLLAGRGLAAAHTGEVAHFTIDGSQAGGGQPEVLLQSRSLSRAVGVALSRAGPALWRASYTAPTPGHYLLRVLWDNRLVKGCPLSVVVSGGADASLVTCSGVGLSQGVVGKEIRSWIDTRRAGPGELTAHCTGPHKVAYCELYEHGDATFTLNVKPQEPGRHQLTVKYAGEHVPGSPFQLRVAGAPDASKVRVYGPGIEPGVLATFQSRFICDTRGAGAGQLTVRVRGPKGAFRVEMQRESQKDRTILCKFDPTEPGDYRVEVKWAGKLVPGSPFPVMIFDTQEELRRYLQTGQVPSQ